MAMDHDHEERPGWVRLPGYDEDPPYSPGAGYKRGGTRDAGMRRVRRASNWTVAALIAGVAAATGYFAHHPAPAAPATTPVSTVPGSTVPGSTTAGGAAAGVHKPSLSAPVVTSSGSGVTVRTGPNGTRVVSYKDD
jgi:hypothetical protein